jgi:hypothetical protein
VDSAGDPVRRRLGEGSWIAVDYVPPERTEPLPFHVWVPTGDDGDGNPTGDVLRWLDYSYTLRVK